MLVKASAVERPDEARAEVAAFENVIQPLKMFSLLSARINLSHEEKRFCEKTCQYMENKFRVHKSFLRRVISFPESEATRAAGLLHFML